MNVSAEIAGDGFVAEYLDYIASHEAPISYHLAALLTIASSAMGMRVQIDRGYPEPLRANLYVLLLGPPASRKTYAMRVAGRVFREAGFPVGHLDDATDEAIVRDMQEKEQSGFKPESTVLCEEFAAFLGRKDYKQDLTKWLCRYYDGGPIRRARARKDGGYKTTDSFLNIFGGATPKGLGEVSDLVIGTGMASRLWIVSEHEKARWVWKPRLDGEPRVRIVAQIKERMERFGGGVIEATLGDAANGTFESWYEGAHRDFVESAESGVESWAGRRHDHAVKAAVLLHLLDGGDPTNLGERGAKRGIAFIEAMEPGMLEAYDALGASTWAAMQEKVVALVRRKGDNGIEARHLMAALSKWLPPPRSKEQMARIVGDLIEGGRVDSQGEGGMMKITWRPPSE